MYSRVPHSDEDEDPVTPQVTRSKRATIAAVSLIFCAVGASVVVGTGNQTWEKLEATSYESAGLTLDVTNEYGALASKSMYKWKHIAEPHRMSTLTAASAKCSASSSSSDCAGAVSGYTYAWTITHNEDGVAVTDYSEGGVGAASVEYGFTKPATMYTVSCVASPLGVSPGVGDTDGFTAASELSLEESVMVKYVRREVRQLTTKDRERYLAATASFHRIDAEAGRATYGAKFTNYKESVTKHLARMSLDKCTPFHGYDTFLTSHEGFVLEFEQALQSIDPRISAPYWDYTIDTVKYGHVDDIASNSILFTNDWFGPLDNSATSDVLSSKYFSSLPVPVDASSPEHNAFGVVTDLTNANPSLFVERFSSICGLPTKVPLAGCTELKSVFATTSLSAFRSTVEQVYHASLHMALGGVKDCAFSLSDASSDATQGGPDRPQLYESIGAMANTMWRTMELGGLMKCSSDGCSSSVEADTFEACSCSCPSVDEWDDSEKYELGYDQLSHFGVVQMLASETATSAYFETSATTGLQKVSGATPDEDEAFWKWLVDFSCHPGKMAPFATPLASNNDPLFWVSHASWGRFWHFMRLSPELSDGFHLQWTDPTEKTFLTDYTNVTDCEGMLKEDDKLPFKGFTVDAATHPEEYAAAGRYTNADMLALISPDNPDLPYVYSDFDWDHCD